MGAMAPSQPGAPWLASSGSAAAPPEAPDSALKVTKIVKKVPKTAKICAHLSLHVTL